VVKKYDKHIIEKQQIIANMIGPMLSRIQKKRIHIVNKRKEQKLKKRRKR